MKYKCHNSISLLYFLALNSCSTAIRHLVPNICQNEARYDPQSLQISQESIDAGARGACHLEAIEVGI
ncbi:hypothetical protein S83_043299 [Arachis hypogaea]